jgi:hypothetical protein
MPIQCEYYALEGLSVMTRLVQQLRESEANPALEIEGIVMTMYDMRTNLSQQVVQEVSTHFGNLVYETLIPRSVRLSECPSFGQPIVAYDARCTGAVAYRQLTREFLRRRKEMESGETASPPPSPEPGVSGMEPADSGERPREGEEPVSPEPSMEPPAPETPTPETGAP